MRLVSTLNIVLLAFVLSCKKDDPETGDSPSDADTDADSDSDADTDADTDSDADSDSDSDSDSDTDTNLPPPQCETYNTEQCLAHDECRTINASLMLELPDDQGYCVPQTTTVVGCEADNAPCAGANTWAKPNEGSTGCFFFLNGCMPDSWVDCPEAQQVSDPCPQDTDGPPDTDGGIDTN